MLESFLKISHHLRSSGGKSFNVLHFRFQEARFIFIWILVLDFSRRHLYISQLVCWKVWKRAFEIKIYGSHYKYVLKVLKYAKQPDYGLDQLIKIKCRSLKCTETEAKQKTHTHTSDHVFALKILFGEWRKCHFISCLFEWICVIINRLWKHYFRTDFRIDFIDSRFNSLTNWLTYWVKRDSCVCSLGFIV